MKLGLKGWLDQLANKQIPILKHRRDQVLEVLNDEMRPSSECRSIILSDPGMAANLLMAINKERSGSNRIPITTVSSLVSMLGVPRLVSEIKAMTCIDDLKLPGSHLKGIQRCLKQSWYCRQFVMPWVLDRKVREPEEVYLAAILQCLPELMLWCYGDDVMLRIEHQAYYECLDYHEEVRQILGCHKREIGTSLAAKWFLPELAGFGFESEYDSFTNGTAVALAALLARLCLHSWYGKDMVFFLQKATHYFGGNEVKTLKHLHQQSLLMVGDEVELGYRPIASLLLATNSERIPELEFYLSSEKKEEPAPVQQISEILPEENKGFDPVLLTKDVEQLKTLVKQGAKMNELLKHVVLSLHDTVLFGRVNFLLLSTDKLKLDSKMTKSTNAADDSLKQFSIELNQQGLFNLLIKKPQTFNLNKNNYDKYWGAISGKIKTSIHVERFCAASVFYGDRPLGMIYADKPQEKISAEDFKAFQQLTMLLNKGLELIAKNKK